MMLALLLLILCIRATHFHIGVFDWDDNLLKLDAKIYFENLVGGAWLPVTLSTSMYAEVQQYPDYLTNWRPSKKRDPFGDFSDQNGDDEFLRQCKQAAINMTENAGGAFTFFKHHLLNGFPINVITARSHAPRNLKKGFEWILAHSTFSTPEFHKMIDAFSLKTFPVTFGFNQFYSNYFNESKHVIAQIASAGEFVGVNNPIFNKLHKRCPTSACKAMVLESIVNEQIHLNDEKLFEQPAIISYSDDDANNVKSAIDSMKKVLIPTYPKACFRVYNTFDKKNPVIYELTDSCKLIRNDIIPNKVERKLFAKFPF